MLKKFTGVLLSAALIVSAVGALTALPTTAASGSFTPQHMEVNFNDYVINDDTAGKANNTYPADNTTSGTKTSKTIWQIGVEDDNNYIYTITNSKVCNNANPANGLYTFILNPTGKAGDSKSGDNIKAEDAIYKLEDGVRYRMTFRYKFQNWDKNTTTGEYNTEVKVKVGASATGVCGWNDGGARFTLQDGETALALQNTTEWKTAEFEFVANMSQGSSWGGTWMDSMMVAFIPYKVGTSTIKAATAFNLYLDDFVVDRVASANIVKNGATETVYGAPACDSEYREGFGTCEADKIPTVSTNGNTVELTALYSDAEFNNLPKDEPVFSATSADTYYAKAIAPKKTEVYVNESSANKYDLGTNAFGTGFAEIKANSSAISGAANIKSGFIIWTKKLLGENTLDITCVGVGNKAINVETTGIGNFADLSDELYGILLCSDAADGKVSDRYSGITYAVRPYVSYEIDGNTYYVYGDTIYSK